MTGMFSKENLLLSDQTLGQTYATCTQVRIKALERLRNRGENLRSASKSWILPALQRAAFVLKSCHS